MKQINLIALFLAVLIAGCVENKRMKVKNSPLATVIKLQATCLTIFIDLQKHYFHPLSKLKRDDNGKIPARH
jgi:hypothetical protein